MITKETALTAIKALEVLEKRVREHVEYNQEQADLYEAQLKSKDAIITVSGGLEIKEEFKEESTARSLVFHRGEVLKKTPKLREYQSALAELKSL